MAHNIKKQSGRTTGKYYSPGKVPRQVCQKTLHVHHLLFGAFHCSPLQAQPESKDQNGMTGVTKLQSTEKAKEGKNIPPPVK